MIPDQSRTLDWCSRAANARLECLFWVKTGKAQCEQMFSALPLPAQPVDATQALNLSAGVSNCKVSRGRSFSHRQVGALRKVLSQQAIGVLVRPALHGLCGSQKYTSILVANVKRR